MLTTLLHLSNSWAIKSEKRGLAEVLLPHEKMSSLTMFGNYSVKWSSIFLHKWISSNHVLHSKLLIINEMS